MAYDGEDEMSEAARRQRAEQLKRDMEAMQNNPGYAPKTFATKENVVANRKVQQQKPTAAKTREGKRGGAPLVLVQLFMLGTPAALFFLPEEAKRAYMKVSRWTDANCVRFLGCASISNANACFDFPLSLSISLSISDAFVVFMFARVSSDSMQHWNMLDRMLTNATAPK